MVFNNFALLKAWKTLLFYSIIKSARSCGGGGAAGLGGALPENV
jgi:hypothetical protein